MKTLNLKFATVSAIVLTLCSSVQAEIPVNEEDSCSSYIVISREDSSIPGEKMITPASPKNEEVMIAAQDQAEAVAAHENRFTKKYLLEPAQQLALSALKAAGKGGYFVAKYAASTAFWYILGPSGINATVQLIATTAAPFTGPLAPTIPLAVKIIQMANTASEYIPIVRDVKYGLIGLATKDIILPGAVVATKVAAKATQIASKYGVAAVKSAFSTGRSAYNWFVKESPKVDADVELESFGTDNLFEDEFEEEFKGASQVSASSAEQSMKKKRDTAETLTEVKVEKVEVVEPTVKDIAASNLVSAVKVTTKAALATANSIYSAGKTFYNLFTKGIPGTI